MGGLRAFRVSLMTFFIAQALLMLMIMLDVSIRNQHWKHCSYQCVVGVSGLATAVHSICLCFQSLVRRQKLLEATARMTSMC